MTKHNPHTLRDAIEDIAALPDDATLFVERIDGKFRHASAVTVLVLSDDDISRLMEDVADEQAPGKDYFLEAFVIMELLEAWREDHHGETPSLDEFLDLVIHFAECDNWPATGGARLEDQAAV